MQVSCTWDSTLHCSWLPGMEFGGLFGLCEHWTVEILALVDDKYETPYGGDCLFSYEICVAFLYIKYIHRHLYWMAS